MKILFKAFCLTICLTLISMAHAAKDDVGIIKKSRRLQTVKRKPVAKKLKAKKKSSRKLGNTDDRYTMNDLKDIFNGTITVEDGEVDLSEIHNNFMPLYRLGNKSTEILQLLNNMPPVRRQVVNFMGDTSIQTDVTDLAGLDSRISALESANTDAININKKITDALGPINTALNAQQAVNAIFNNRITALEDEFYVPLNARTTGIETTVSNLQSTIDSIPAGQNGQDGQDSNPSDVAAILVNDAELRTAVGDYVAGDGAFRAGVAADDDFRVAVAGYTAADVDFQAGVAADADLRITLTAGLVADADLRVAVATDGAFRAAVIAALANDPAFQAALALLFY